MEVIKNDYSDILQNLSTFPHISSAEMLEKSPILKWHAVAKHSPLHSNAQPSKALLKRLI